ncbi:MAG: hypothetical protein JST82_13285 [Bacteroidetes bacterium]|nr:hypothetical protein [Bacteroidota bacterium]
MTALFAIISLLVCGGGIYLSIYIYKRLIKIKSLKEEAEDRCASTGTE